MSNPSSKRTRNGKIASIILLIGAVGLAVIATINFAHSNKYPDLDYQYLPPAERGIGGIPQPEPIYKSKIYDKNQKQMVKIEDSRKTKLRERAEIQIQISAILIITALITFLITRQTKHAEVQNTTKNAPSNAETHKSKLKNTKAQHKA